MSLCGLTLVRTQKRSLKGGYMTQCVFSDGPSPWLGERRWLSSRCVLELYLSLRNCGHVNLCSDQNSASVNMVLCRDAHACYFAIIYMYIHFLFGPLNK